MKKIYFIRHAKSLRDGITPDFNRVLAPRGKSDAKMMAARLKARGIKPDLIISSSAKRTRKTAKIMAKTLGFKGKIKLEKSLYACEIEDYMNIIHAIKNKYKSVFIVGHNDEITKLCEYLSKERVGHIPTSGVYAIGFDVTKFVDIKEGSGKTLFFDYPKNIVF